MTSELHMHVIKQQAGVSGRKSTNRKLSNQAIAVYDTQRRAVRQTLLKLDKQMYMFRFAMRTKSVKT